MHALLSAIPLLREAGPDAAADVEAAGTWFSLPGGWTLFKAGEPAEALHLVIAGALVVMQPRSDGEEELVGYVRAGEPVGEMALIAGGSHTASVYALRDTELMRIERADFERLWHVHPGLIQSLARRMLTRARQPRPDMRAAAPRVFALIALSPSIGIESIARDFAGRIERRGLKCAILGEDAYDQPTAYFEDMEEKHDVVLLVARLQDSPWFRLVLRQADRLWLFARRDARPSSPMPLVPDEQSVARRFRLVDLIYLHEGSYDAATPADWIAAVGATRFFRRRTDADVERLVRIMIGRSVGLVLSGGGARAYAHVGVIRALREANIPIDFIGGTSMGAIIAGGIALGWTREELDERLRDAFVNSNPLGDHHLPVVALVEGKIVEERLHKHFGDVRIEDLGLPMFCLSADLVSGKARIHTSGILRHALRASIALPGILPPVADDGGVLVDGAVLNNFPTDVMQLMHRGLTVGCDVAQQGSINPQDFVDPPSFMRWIGSHGFRDAPPIVSLLMRAATVGINPNAGRKDCDLIVVPDLDGIDIRDWKAYDSAVEAGYAATVKALQIAGNVLPRE